MILSPGKPRWPSCYISSPSFLFPFPSPIQPDRAFFHRRIVQARLLRSACHLPAWLNPVVRGRRGVLNSRFGTGGCRNSPIKEPASARNQRRNTQQPTRTDSAISVTLFLAPAPRCVHLNIVLALFSVGGKANLAGRASLDCARGIFLAPSAPNLKTSKMRLALFGNVAISSPRQVTSKILRQV